MSLNLADLKKNGLNAALLCFVPASLEIVGYTVFGTLILSLNVIDLAILGCVMAAVSPAVILHTKNYEDYEYGKDFDVYKL